MNLSALVTGASRGIGRAIAHRLATRSIRVAVHYRRNHEAAAATLASLPGTGHAAFAADVSQPAEVERLWREVTATFGRVDIVVNNAGIYDLHSPLTTSFADWQILWRRTLDANLHGPANLSLLAAQHMAAAPADPDRGRGRIINISSRGAFRGEPNAPAYGASKAGLNSLSQSLAVALASAQIYVYAIAPGWVETDMAAKHIHGPRRTEILAQHPLSRVASTDEIAQTAVFCALDAPAAMTGAVIDVNGASYLRT